MERLKSIINIPFLVSLAILLLNDFYLKQEYHNWITGKLSDFCGLFVFVSFWSAIFPAKRLLILFFVGIIFTLWKSPYSQIFINAFSEHIYPINRVVDVTDLIALIILPCSFFYQPKNSLSLNINPLPIGLVTIFSFCATSMPEPILVFENPQYLLTNSGIVLPESDNYINDYEIHKLDSFSIISIKSIGVERRSVVKDDFQKVQIVKNIEKRILKEIKSGNDSLSELSDYDIYKETFLEDGRTSIVLKLDSVTDVLRFLGSRLDGEFKRTSYKNQILIEGFYNMGLEDSIWIFYNTEGVVEAKKYYRRGEIVKQEVVRNGEIVSQEEFDTRLRTIQKKYFHLAILLILIGFLILKLIISIYKAKHLEIIKVPFFGKLASILILPILIFITAKFISQIIPNHFSIDIFQFFSEAILVFALSATVIFLLFLIKFRNWMSLIYCILILILIVIFVEESIQLINVIEE